MKRTIAVVLATTAVACGALAASASAHNVFRDPKIDAIGSTFRFTGEAWQPNKRVRYYFDEFNNGSFQQTGRFFTNSSGRFTFDWTHDNTTGKHRMCFKQFDSRSRFQQEFFKCRTYFTISD